MKSKFVSIASHELRTPLATILSSAELLEHYSDGLSAEDKLKYLPDTCSISLRASVRILNPSPDEKGQIILVVSVNDAENKTYLYNVAKDSEINYKAGEWFELSRTDLIKRDVPVNGSYKVYVWYKGKKKIYVDDLKLEFMPVGYE